MVDVDNLLGKITYPMTIMIRVVGLWPNFLNFVRISRFFYFKVSTSIKVVLRGCFKKISN